MPVISALGMCRFLRLPKLRPPSLRGPCERCRRSQPHPVVGNQRRCIDTLAIEPAPGCHHARTRRRAGTQPRPPPAERAVGDDVVPAAGHEAQVLVSRPVVVIHDGHRAWQLEARVHPRRVVAEDERVRGFDVLDFSSFRIRCQYMNTTLREYCNFAPIQKISPVVD